MNMTFGPRGSVQIDDARIIFRNLEGRGGVYNREGDRSFALVVPDDTAREALVEAGYNVRVKPPREGYEDDGPLMYLPIKVKFSDGRGPHIYLRSGRNQRELTENTVGLIDNISIASVDLDIHQYNWTVQGKTGVTAYLSSMRVTQNVDRFAEDAPEETAF